MATDALHFANPPITEAIIAIVVRDLPGSIVERIRTLSDKVSAEYPKRTEISQTQFVGEISPEGPKASAQQKAFGLQFQSIDSRQIFQARLNGFSFHRLAPYDRWRTFRDEAFRLWSLFRDVVGDVEAVAFSVRYINALVVPAPGRIEDYLRVYPEIPAEWPQNLSNYQMRLELPIQDAGTGTGALATVQTLLPSEPGTASILLDNNLSYPAIGNSDDTLWSRIDAVQAVKNNLFLASITPAMRKRIS